MRNAAAAAMVAIFLASASAAAKDSSGWHIEQLTQCRNGQSNNAVVSSTGAMVFFISNCDLTRNNFDHNTEIFKWENGGIDQLTDTRNCQIGDLALSPDDKRLAFTTDCKVDFNSTHYGPEMQVAVMFAPGDIKVITEGIGFSSSMPAWSPREHILAFQSGADLTGANMDHNTEIFIADLSNPEKPPLKQLSSSLGPGWCEWPQASTSSVICRCSTDLPGTGSDETGLKVFNGSGQEAYGNPDRNWEIYSFDFDGAVRQLTKTTNCANGAPRLSPGGLAAAFISNCPPPGAGRELSQSRIYLLTPKIIPVFKDLSINCSAPILSADNSHLALSSNYGNASLNPEHNQQIFTVTLPGPAQKAPEKGLELPESALTQVTHFENGAAYAPTISRDGKAIAFVSTADPKGSNSDANPEIFLAVKK